VALTNKKLRKLFGNLTKNAGEIVEHKLDQVDERLEVLEDKERWRDIVALCQEYKEWATEESDFEMIYMDRLKTITGD